MNRSRFTRYALTLAFCLSAASTVGCGNGNVMGPDATVAEIGVPTDGSGVFNTASSNRSRYRRAAKNVTEMSFEELAKMAECAGYTVPHPEPIDSNTSFEDIVERTQAIVDWKPGFFDFLNSLELNAVVAITECALDGPPAETQGGPLADVQSDVLSSFASCVGVYAPQPIPAGADFGEVVRRTEEIVAWKARFLFCLTLGDLGQLVEYTNCLDSLSL